jgi:hypothetical protein
MATCTYCSQEMIGGSSCSLEVLHRDGGPFPLAKVAARDLRKVGEGAGGCGDCGAPKGGFHHLGCDQQRCPSCGYQMISCGCWFDEDGVSIADDEETFFDFVLHHWEGYVDAS